MGNIPDLPTLPSFRKMSDPALLSAWMNNAVQLSNKKPQYIKTLHDELLYHLAFPLNAGIYHNTRQYMERLTGMVQQVMTGKNRRVQEQLSGTGIAFTLLNCSYSYTLATSLASKFPHAFSISGSDATPEEVVAVFRQLLPAIEFDTITQGSFTLSARIQNIAGVRSPVAQLQWLMELFQQSHLELSIKEILYQQLKLFLQWELVDPEYSRSFLRIPFTKNYYTRSTVIPVTNPEKIREEKLKRVKLLAVQQQQLAMIVKTSLAYYYRETDPFTYADPTSIRLFDMGRGLNIALIGMYSAQRLSLESYIGYMAFKNGIPVAYGGGWIWGYRCKIGLNIYPPFRKAESDWLFCQVLRLYQQYYQINHFIVRPYQFGKSNPEGIRSGAFWFYYKLGFRPVEDGLRSLAASEWKMISANKKYRTPAAVLKQFTASDMQVSTGTVIFPSFGANVLSAAISREINMKYGRSREKALHAASIQLKKHFSPSLMSIVDQFPATVWEHFLFLSHCMADLHSWNEKEKRLLVELYRYKSSGDESKSIIRSQAHLRMWRSLEAYISHSR